MTTKVNYYTKYKRELMVMILEGEIDDELYPILQRMNLHAHKTYELNEMKQYTLDNYILNYQSGMRIVIQKNSILGKILESGDFEIDYNTGNILITEEIIEKQKKEQQRIWYENHPNYNINYNKEHPINQIDKIETTFLNKLQNLKFSGICFACGEVAFIGSNHHIFGKDKNDFTLFVCNKCHYNTRGKHHYIIIGRKIEKLF